MNEPKKKLCWNCEGSVAKHLETCPYCGVYLSPTEQAPSDIPKPPYPVEPEVKEEVPAMEEPSSASFATPLLLLLSGSTFLLFGLTLWLFSDQGRLTLSWNGDWGAVFLLLSLPLLGFGLRSFIRLD